MMSVSFESPLVVRTLLAEANPSLFKSVEGVPGYYMEIMVRDELMEYLASEQEQFILNIHKLVAGINETLSEMHGDNEKRKKDVLTYYLYPDPELGKPLSEALRTFYDLSSKGEEWADKYELSSIGLYLSAEKRNFFKYEIPFPVRRKDVESFYLYCSILQWSLRYSFYAEESAGEVVSFVDGVRQDWVKLFEELRQFNKSFNG